MIRTQCREGVCKEDVPVWLCSIHCGQCVPHGKETMGILVCEGSPGIQQLAQEGPAVGVKALSEQQLGFWLQRAEFSDHSPGVQLQGRGDIVHSFLWGRKGTHRKGRVGAGTVGREQNRVVESGSRLGVLEGLLTKLFPALPALRGCSLPPASWSGI